MEKFEAVLKKLHLPPPQVISTEGDLIIYGVPLAQKSDALRTWQALYQAREETGCYPLVETMEWSKFQNECKHRRDWNTFACLERAAHVNPVEWFVDVHSGKMSQNRMKIQIEYFRQKGIPLLPHMEGIVNRPLRTRNPYLVPEGDWPKVAQQNSFPFLEREDKGKSIPDQYLIRLLPTLFGWQAPAFQMAGNHNSSPTPEIHTAIFKMWWEKFGARPVLVGNDYMELWIENPPKTKKEAWELWVDFCAYAEFESNSEEGEDIQNAAALINGTVWHFWWD